MNIDQEFKEYLYKRKISYTSQRLAVFKALYGSEPQEISNLIERLNPLLDRSSVYRAIRIFEKIGLINRVYSGWKYKVELSDAFQAHHHHMTCIKCKKIFMIRDESSIEKTIDNIAQKEGFTLSGHTLELQGYCRSCNNKSA